MDIRSSSSPIRFRLLNSSILIGNSLGEVYIDFAIKNLPLELLGSGPKDAAGIGEHYQKHSSLDRVVTFLENYPKKGEKLILVGLDSPVTRNRNMSLRTLQSWASSNWNEEIRTKLNELKEIEQNADTKSDLVKLLNGKKIE